MRLMLLLFIATAGLARAESTEEMLSSCGKLAEAKVQDGQVMVPQDFESGRCWGAFGVLLNLTRLIKIDETKRLQDDTKRILGVCSSKENTRTQAIAIFVEYARRNPSLFHEEFWIVALDALKAAFPCPSK